MRYIADLHIHSRYSRATSKASHLHGLAAWAAIKGIQVLGTGDFTHPGWFDHLRENLEEAEPGFFRLRSPDAVDLSNLVPPGIAPDLSRIRFVLTSEISSIYKRGGRVRKVHNLLFAPDFASVRRINATLAGIGNLEADGRPILGLDSRTLLEIQLQDMPEGFLVPAHIWTPWFSLFGSKSGFDAIEECFGDLAGQIFALETGLSSDPDMNRLVSSLDRFTLVSNSDCHSPAKLGREANLFATGLDYFSMRNAIRCPVDADGRQVFTATIEFYPEEGKYHCDGHRKCGICLEPKETIREQGICPRCGKPLTIGVLYRIMELADRQQPQYPPGSPGVHSLIPLPEMLSEMLGTGPATKKVMAAYAKLITNFGSEFELLLNTPVDDIADHASPMLAEAVRRVRENRVIRRPGFDGEFGVIRVFSDEERRSFGGQLSLFGITAAKPRKKKKASREKPLFPVKKKQDSVKKGAHPLSPDQEQVVTSAARHIIVTAGPGTGKTHTLVQRLFHVITRGETPCTVITFTNKAADEVRQRLEDLGAGQRENVFVATFHGYCLHWLRMENPALAVAGPELRHLILRRLFPAKSDKELRELSSRVSEFCRDRADYEKRPYISDLEQYAEELVEQNLVDIDAVVPEMVRLLRQNGPRAAAVRRQTGQLFVDEFQDLNRAQFQLVCLLAGTSPVFAIGDPDQAIYGFRGSDPQYFYRFIEELAPQQHLLTRNYRSRPVIVRAAADVIAPNHAGRPVPPVGTLKEEGGGLFFRQCSTAVAEARFVAATVEQLLGGTSHREIDRLTAGQSGVAALADIAVLYRTGGQAEILADALAGHGLPCQVVNLSAFYTTGPCRVLYLWTLTLAGLGDSSHYLSLLGMEKGIGPQALSRVEQHLPVASGYGWDIFLQRLAPVHDGTLAGVLNELRQFSSRLDSQIADSSAAALMVPIIERYGLAADDPEIRRFLQMAGSSGAILHDFARHLQRYSDSVVYDARAEAVTLMTLHAAKGLEFPFVFITGVEEELLPLAPRRDLTAEELVRHVEEERRLFFVGMTRAIEALYLTCAASRRVHGAGSRRRPSRFLADIPAVLLDTPEVRRPKKRKTYRQLSLFS